MAVKHRSFTIQLSDAQAEAMLRILQEHASKPDLQSIEKSTIARVQSQIEESKKRSPP